ncbi:MAG: hypothetical protein N3I35_10715 [Clostridia bacterium]|nr:hypothetical protein [Clostridia bacterium]
MKKLLLLIITTTLFLSLISCGKITEYTKEFSYIPSYPGTTLKSTEPANEQGFSKAIYLVKDTTISEVADNYERIFHDDGWKTTDNQKPTVFTVEKEKHIAVIALSQIDKDTNLFIYTK